MKYSEVNKLGLSKGDWTPLAQSGEGYHLWQVVTKEGTAHEVVTLDLYGETLIVEVDEEKVW